MSEDKKTVSEAYEIDENLLLSLSTKERKKKNFFRNSLHFYQQVKNRTQDSLTEKQKNWLHEIESILHDRKGNLLENETKPAAQTEILISKQKEIKFAYLPTKVNNKWIWLKKYESN